MHQWLQRSYACAIGVSGLLMAPCAVAAQFDLSAGYGITERVNERPRRTLTDSFADLTDSPGEGTTVWLRGSYWFAEKMAVQASGTYMWDTSFSGGGRVPLPDFQVNTTYLDARVIYAPFGSLADLGLEVGIGPAIILHGGTGSSLLSRQTDIGISFSGAARVRIAGGFGAQADGQIHWYSSQFKAIGNVPATSESQRDWTLSLGVGWRW